MGVCGLPASKAPPDITLSERLTGLRRDVYLRMCKERGVKVVISTDSHNTMHLPYIKYGVTTARRAWLEKSNVINTLPVDKFLAALRQKPGSDVKTVAAKGTK